MKKYRTTYCFTVDEEALAAHDSDHSPPPPDVDEWYDTDLHKAVELGIAELEHTEMEMIEEVGP